MNRHRHVTVSAFILSFLLATLYITLATTAQQQSVSEKSYLEARRVLDAGIQALGGRDALSMVTDFSFKFKGTSYARHQSLTPATPYSAETIEGALAADTGRNWISFEQMSTLPGYKFWGRQILKNNQGFAIDLIAGTVAPITNPNFYGNATRTRLPHLLLLFAANERASTLRSLGTATFQGRKQNVITYAHTDGTQIALYFDAQTNLLTKLENMDSDAVDGDVLLETIFPSYTAINGVKIPAGRILKRGGDVIQDIKYTDVQVNTGLSDSMFEKPTNLMEIAQTPPPPTGITVKELAKDVFLLQDVANGYNSMVVAFNDYILVAEAPIGDAASKRAIAKIKELVPNKPIKYLVLTHFHDDHSGGTRTYIAEGATLITTPGNQKFFERMAASNRTIDPDTLTKAARRPQFELLQNKKRVLTDGEHTVEIYDIGPSPHAREMLMLYLPKERILFQGDLLNLPTQAGVVRPANQTTIHFAEVLRSMNLKVETIVGVHGRPGTMDDLRESLGKRMP